MYFGTENMWFWESLGPAKSSWDSSESVIFIYSPNHEKVTKKCLKWIPKFQPLFQKIWPAFRLIGRVSPQPPLFTAYARPCNFNHPVGCFPSSIQKPKKSRSGPPGVFRGAPWAPQVSKMLLQGTKRCLKVPSRHLKSAFWAHQISAASSQPSTHKMKAAGIKSQVKGPAAEAKPVDMLNSILNKR